MSPHRRGHLARWLAGAVLVVLVVVGIVLATRTPQEATQVQSPLQGKTAPAFTGVSLTKGTPVSLGALRGHYVVLNFFASWCIPCQQEAPDLSRFYYQQSHATNGAQVVSVVFHDTTSTAKGFMLKNGDLWPAISDPGGAIAERYGVTGPPTTFLVDPDGRITVEPETGPATQTELQDMIQQARKQARSGGAGGPGDA